MKDILNNLFNQVERNAQSSPEMRAIVDELQQVREFSPGAAITPYTALLKHQQQNALLNLQQEQLYQQAQKQQMQYLLELGKQDQIRVLKDHYGEMQREAQYNLLQKSLAKVSTDYANYQQLYKSTLDQAQRTEMAFKNKTEAQVSDVGALFAGSGWALKGSYNYIVSAVRDQGQQQTQNEFRASVNQANQFQAKAQESANAIGDLIKDFQNNQNLLNLQNQMNEII